MERGVEVDDLISTWIAVEEAGDQLNNDEIVTMCALRLAAGNITTTDLIGNGVWTRPRHPDQLQKLRAAPALITNAVAGTTPVLDPTNDLESGAD